jgi:uridine kinase
MSKHMLVGIAGGSASGKTTLVRALSEALREQGLPHQVISSDRFMHRNITDGPSFTFSVTGERTFNANHPDSIRWTDLTQELDALMEQPGDPQIIVLEGHLVLPTCVRAWTCGCSSNSMPTNAHCGGCFAT